jgi:adenylosuccinate synthase
MELTKVDPKRVGIDQNASIIEQKHSDQDKASAVNKGIGTQDGALDPHSRKRVRRTAKLAKDMPELKAFLCDGIQEVNDGLDEGKSVILEGTQGFMLSLFLSGGYPMLPAATQAHQPLPPKQV